MTDAAGPLGWRWTQWAHQDDRIWTDIDAASPFFVTPNKFRVTIKVRELHLRLP
jgi:hypothetical protein